MTEQQRRERLTLLEQGGAEAEAALEALKASWVKEDADMAAEREAILVLHEQGAVVRDQMRRELSGVSEAPPIGVVVPPPVLVTVVPMDPV